MAASLDELVRIAALTQSTLTSFALVVGGAWALRKYLASREGTWNLRLELEHEGIPYGESCRLLLIDVVLSNIGKRVISPGSKGCSVEVRLLQQDLEAPSVLRLDSHSVPLLEENVILNRGSAEQIKYELEPGSTFRHTAAFVVPCKVVVEARSTFWWKDNSDSISQRRVFYVD